MTGIPQQTRDAAVATYLGGASLTAAAAQHGVGPSSVQRWVAKATKGQPQLLENRHHLCEGAPRVYRGGWTPSPGGILRPLVNIRTSTRPTQGDTAA